MPNQTIIENLQNETDILQTSLSEKERLLNIKENQTTKLETEVTHLKKQLSTNRSYSITLEGKNRELQGSNMIATQEIMLSHNKNILMYNTHKTRMLTEMKQRT